MMKPDCEVCGGKSIAEVVNPAVGEYSACDPCMMAGARPPCHKGCGRPSEFIAAGHRWCCACHDVDRNEKEQAAAARRAKSLKAAEAEIDARINAGIEKALKERGL